VWYRRSKASYRWQRSPVPQRSDQDPNQLSVFRSGLGIRFVGYETSFLRHLLEEPAVLFIDYSIIEDHVNLVSSQTAHAT